MQQHHATKIAIQCIEAEIKRLAVNANLEDQYHSGLPMCIQASKRRTELRAAIEALKQPKQVMF
jgi:hypothetical protein